MFNGKKIFKWFLRLLPIFELIFMGCYMMAKVNNINQGLGNSNVNLTSINFNSIWSACSFYSMRNVPIVSNIRDFMKTYFFNNVSYDLISYICTIVYYEIIVSIVFIVFDLFNFMLSVVSNFINKGEKLNE